MRHYETGWSVAYVEKLSRKLLTVEALTLQKTYETAHGMEVAEKRASELQSSTKAIGAVREASCLQLSGYHNHYHHSGERRL